MFSVSDLGGETQIVKDKPDIAPTRYFSSLALIIHFIMFDTNVFNDSHKIRNTFGMY